MEATGEATTADAAVDRDAGRVLVGVDVAGTALFAVTAVAEAILLDRWSQVLGVAVALALFAAGCAMFLVGYAHAIQRSRTEEISVAGLYLLAGPAVPAPVKRRLAGLLAIQVIVAITTAGFRTFTPLAFGVLVPVFGLGVNGLWTARHGRFAPRRRQMKQNAGHG